MTDGLGHWRTYETETGWLRFAYPPDWYLVKNDSEIRLLAPDVSVILVLGCFWKPENERSDLESLLNPEKIFGRPRKIRPLAALPIEYTSIGLEGEAYAGIKTPWWKKPFLRNAWRRWRAWAIEHGSVRLVAVATEPGPRDPQRNDQIESILRTVEFMDDPSAPPEEFARRVLELSRRKFPLEDAELTEDFQLRLGESRLNLANFYRSFIRMPEHFERIVLPALTTLVRAQELGPDQLDPPLEIVAERIMPILYAESACDDSMSRFFAEPWVGGLARMYVVDEAEAYWYIRDELRAQWGLSSEELHERAIENLEAYFERQPMEFTLAGDEAGTRILIPNRPDVYNAARLLSPTFHQKLREVLGGEFAVGVPNRDSFVAFSLDSNDMVDHLRSQVAADFARMDHPLSDRLLLVSADGVSELVDDWWMSEGDGSA